MCHAASPRRRVVVINNGANVRRFYLLKWRIRFDGAASWNNFINGGSTPINYEFVNLMEAENDFSHIRSHSLASHDSPHGHDGRPTSPVDGTPPQNGARQHHVARNK